MGSASAILARLLCDTLSLISVSSPKIVYSRCAFLFWRRTPTLHTRFPRNVRFSGAVADDAEARGRRNVACAAAHAAAAAPKREVQRFALSTEIQTSSGPTPVDPLIAHDQADPRACDLWIGQIDILPSQPRALAMRINQPSARSIVPIK